MDLFELNNGKIIPSVHALMIEPFKSMWEKDKSSDKAEAINMFSYVELLCSPKMSNPFHGYHDDVRPKKVKQNIWGDENYQSDLYSAFEIIRAVDSYRTFLQNAAPGYELYLSALKAADALRDYLNTVDLNERAKSGAMVIKPKDVTSALNDISGTIEGLHEGRKRVLADMKESSKTRSNREVGYFER